MSYPPLPKHWDALDSGADWSFTLTLNVMRAGISQLHGEVVGPIGAYRLGLPMRLIRRIQSGVRMKLLPTVLFLGMGSVGCLGGLMSSGASA